MKQPGGPGRFDVPEWDPASQKKIRDLLKALRERLPDWNGAAGPKGQVDEVRHLIVMSTGWGPNPGRDLSGCLRRRRKTASPLSLTSKTSGRLLVHQRVQRRRVFSRNQLRRYAQQYYREEGSDLSVTIHFGGCGATTPNCLPIMKDWNYMVRQYRPRPSIVKARGISRSTGPRVTAATATRTV